MLVLSRTQGETLKVGDNLEIVVVAVSRGKVKLGFRCPSDLKVLRGEVADRDRQHIPSIAEHSGAGMWDGEAD